MAEPKCLRLILLTMATTAAAWGSGAAMLFNFPLRWVLIPYILIVLLGAISVQVIDRLRIAKDGYEVQK